MKILKTPITAAVSEDQSHFDTVKVGTAYKVFRVKNGKLYPPMVANSNKADTPIGQAFNRHSVLLKKIQGLIGISTGTYRHKYRDLLR